MNFSSSACQSSFSKTGTMGTLASQAEICVWVGPRHQIST